MRGNCFWCGRWDELERHHIFGGPNRKKSEKYNLVVDLCARCHREGPEAAHKNRDTALKLHQYGQRKYMEQKPATTEMFISEFGKNYL